mgnify:CR=1 FL=1
MNKSDKNAVPRTHPPRIRGVLTSAGETTSTTETPYEPTTSDLMQTLIDWLKDKKQKDEQEASER